MEKCLPWYRKKNIWRKAQDEIDIFILLRCLHRIFLISFDQSAQRILCETFLSWFAWPLLPFLTISLWPYFQAKKLLKIGRKKLIITYIATSVLHFSVPVWAQVEIKYQVLEFLLTLFANFTGWPLFAFAKAPLIHNYSRLTESLTILSIIYILIVTKSHQKDLSRPWLSNLTSVWKITDWKRNSLNPCLLNHQRWFMTRRSLAPSSIEHIDTFCF